MALEYVPVFWDWIEVTGELNDQEKGRLIDAMVMYSRGGDWQDRIKGNERYLFPAFRQQIERARTMSEKRADAGSTGGKQAQANASKAKQIQANASKSKQTKANASKIAKKEEEEKEKEVATTGCGGGFLTEEEAQSLSARLDEVYAEAERCGFSCTAREIDELTALSSEHGAERVCSAIRIASDRGKPNLGYLRGILARDESSATDKHGEAYDPTGGLGWL